MKTLRPIFSFLTIFSLLAWCAGGLPLSLTAQIVLSGQPDSAAALNWPRTYSASGYSYEVYQPQISAWPSNQLQGRAVVGVKAPNGSTTFGVAFFQARTDIDKVNRLVAQDEGQYMATLKSFQHQTMRVIPLDHLETVFAQSSAQTRTKFQTVRNDPPRIFYATQPALL